MLPDGSYVRGELPKGIHGHYGPELVAYVLHQYHTCRVTEPLLLEQLKARGVLISAGQLNNILINNKGNYSGIAKVNNLNSSCNWRFLTSQQLLPKFQTLNF